MCGSSPDVTPTQQTQTETKKEVVEQKQASAATTKADTTNQISSKEATTGATETADASTLGTAGTRNKQTGLAGRDVKTAPRGLSDLATIQKKSLLGG